MNLSLNSSVTKLSKIQVLKFNGNTKKFFNFKNLFVSLVHLEDSVPLVQKLYYLKNVLVGEASGLVRDAELSTDSYYEI